MNAKMLNLGLMFVWLIVFVGLLLRDLWMGDEWLNRIAGQQVSMMLAVAGVLFAWNFVRFYVAHKFSVTPDTSDRNETRRKIREKLGDAKITDPQFRFDDPPKG